MLQVPPLTFSYVDSRRLHKIIYHGLITEPTHPPAENEYLAMQCICNVLFLTIIIYLKLRPSILRLYKPPWSDQCHLRDILKIQRTAIIYFINFPTNFLPVQRSQLVDDKVSHGRREEHGPTSHAEVPGVAARPEPSYDKISGGA